MPKIYLKNNDNCDIELSSETSEDSKNYAKIELFADYISLKVRTESAENFIKSSNKKTEFSALKINIRAKKIEFCAKKSLKINNKDQKNNLAITNNNIKISAPKLLISADNVGFNGQKINLISKG